MLIDAFSQNNPGPKWTNTTVVKQGQGQKLQTHVCGGGGGGTSTHGLIKELGGLKCGNISTTLLLSVKRTKQSYDQLICKKYMINCKNENTIIKLCQTKKINMDWMDDFPTISYCIWSVCVYVCCIPVFILKSTSY